MVDRITSRRILVMRAKLSIVIATALVFGGMHVVLADCTITQITQNAYEDNLPEMTGGYIVWQGQGSLPGAEHGASDWEIFLYSMVTGTTTQVTDNKHDDLSPQTDGKYVTWWADQPSRAEIWLYDIETAEKTLISPDDGRNHCLPVVANGRVAWTGFVSGDLTSREILIYDVSNGVEQLTTNNRDDNSPRIYHTGLVWLQTDEEGNVMPYMHDFAGNTGPAPEQFMGEDSRQSHGAVRVLTRYDGLDWEIAVRNNYLKGFEFITDNAIDDEYPRISGNCITWMAGKGKMREIFLGVYRYLVPAGPRSGLVLPKGDPPTFTWKCAGYTKLRVGFSADPDFSTTNTLSLPLGGEWLSGTSFTPSKREWWLIRWIAKRNGAVHWRVKGEDPDGNMGFSDTCHFSIKKSRRVRSNDRR
jgi:hypothetical protein